MIHGQDASVIGSPNQSKGSGALRPRILFVTLANYVGSDRLVAGLARQGMECAVLGRPDGYCSKTRFATRRFFLPSQLGPGLAMVVVASRLEAIALNWKPNLVIPVDLYAMQILRMMAVEKRTSPQLRALLNESLGSPRGYETACNRWRLLELAKHLNIRTPAAWQIQDRAAALEAAAAGYPIVLKREGTSGGSGVQIVRTAQALEAALRAAGLGRPAWWRQKWTRTINRMFAGLAGFGTVYDDALLAQKYIDGTLAMRTVFCSKGRVLEGLSFKAVQVNPEPTGPSSVIQSLEHAEMDAAASRIVAALECSGFVSFDFILDNEGCAHLIEMNARPIPNAHLGRLVGHDMCAAVAANLLGQVRMPQATNPNQTLKIALFPQELARDPQSSYLRAPHPSALHDLPQDDPAVKETYLRWLSRMHPRHKAELRAICDQVDPMLSSAGPSRASQTTHECPGALGHECPEQVRA